MLADKLQEMFQSALVGLMILMLALSAAMAVQNNRAYAHFFGGKTVSIDNYQVVFLPSPSSPYPGNSTSLNFSVLENNTNIYNIHSALIITEKRSGKIVEQIPYKLYEFSDITIPYTFQNATDYSVMLQTRITGDEKYQAEPLVASFNISIIDPRLLIPFDDLMLFYVTPAAVAVAGIAIYLDLRKKL